MPEQGFAKYQAAFSDITAELQDVFVPPSALSRWAALAGELATAGRVPNQPSAA